ncbi:unnamed protein product [Blepharisma stoltei]|uniref:F-box associated domain-containing protein n=1 Tax=Blepharisma stoltei TaxID=1481888 RepID=A0AAU9JC41_9CILI|nr:unnamed protein product [Blepharisma stoltei]
MESNLIQTKNFVNLPQYIHENELTTSKLRWFGYKSSDIIEYNLETLEKSAYKHKLPHSTTNQIMFMCPLPGDKLFCYSSYLEWQEECCDIFIIDENNDIEIIQKFRFSMWNSSDEKGIAFEEDDKKVLKTFPRGLSNLWSFAAYYNNVVYISMKFVMGFDLISRRWHTLVKNDKEYCWCTSTSFNGKILALEYYSWSKRKNIRKWGKWSF